MCEMSTIVSYLKYCIIQFNKLVYIKHELFSSMTFAWPYHAVK